MTLALRARLTLVYTAVFGLLILAVGVTAYAVLARQLDADATMRLTELTSGLHGYLSFDAGIPSVTFDAGDPQQAAFVHAATRYYQIFDAHSGRLLVQSAEIEALGLSFTAAEVRALGVGPAWYDVETDYGRFRISNSLISPGDGDNYLLQVATSLEPVDRVLDRFLVLLVIGIPVSLVAAFLGGTWMAGLALAPLSRVAEAARAIDITDLRRRLPVRGASDEVDEVAAAFNETLARLERAVNEMRQFSGALAHELRTPLTALRGQIELARLSPGSPEERERRLASQLEDIDRLKRLIDQLLTLARAEAGEIPIARTPVDVGALTASLVDQLELVAQAKGVTIEQTGERRLIVTGDAHWLERLLLNVVDNAIKFTPPHGRVTIALMRDDTRARVEVRDTGIGMPPEVRARLFERFFQADPARSPAAEGFGLGLSLVKWIADRHDGRIDVVSEPGVGSVFTVYLPLARV